MKKKFLKTLLIIPTIGLFLGSCLTKDSLSTVNNQELSEKKVTFDDISTTHKQDSSTMKSIPSIDQSKLNVINAKKGWNKNLLVEDVLYDLYIPANYHQNPQTIIKSLLVLPGWNFSRSSWIENSNLVKYAEEYGYVLILPEMGKTLYESRYYSETKMKWNTLPGGQFIKEKFIPTMQQQHNLLVKGQHNTMLGLSTGGRGVVLIALENPDLFVAGASLSGDFSQENMPTDKLMTSVYGSFSQFPQRWQGKDNPQNRVNEWKMPLYLAHGTADNIVPESQSKLFYDTLMDYHQGNSPVEYHAVKNAGHDYNFWGGQLEVVFQFIDRD